MKTSIEEYKQLVKKKNKYGAIKTEYNGRIYDSKAEANYAKRLQYLKHAKNLSERVAYIEYQVPYYIQIKGNKIVGTYFADFKVTYGDGRVEVVDVKGVKTPLYRFKKKCVEAGYNIIIKEEK